MKHLKRFESTNWKNNLYSILEKKIAMGDDLRTKLSHISNDDSLAKKMLDFFSSSDIKDDAKIAKIDYNKEDGKLLTVVDDKGQERKFKFGKLLKYLGYDTSNVKPYEVENFLLNFAKAKTENLKLMSGKDILYSYNCKNYDDVGSAGGGSLGFSCMRFERAQKYLEIYTSNPNQVQCLTLLNPDNNKVQGRALVWTTESGQKYMDRIYVLSKELEKEFKQYAEENKIGKSSSNVKLDNNEEFDYYPYMDTYHYYTPDTGILSTNDGDLILQSTEGSFSGEGGMVWSDFLQENIMGDESVYSQCMGSHIYEHDATKVIAEVDENGQITKYDWIIDDESISAGGLAEAVDIAYTSKKYKELEGEKALIDICKELEGGEHYVLEDDTEIWDDSGWGVLVKSDMLSFVDFDIYAQESYAIKVTYDNADSPDEYQPFGECCAVYNPEEERFDIIHEEDDWEQFFDEMYGDNSDVEYDRDEYDYDDYEQLSYMDDRKYTERVFVHSSIMKEKSDIPNDVNNSPLLADGAPLAVAISTEYIVKSDDNFSELHDNVYIESEKIDTSCFKTKNGDIRLFPPMENDNIINVYGTVDGLISTHKKSMISRQSTKIDANTSYYIRAMRKGKELESNLLNVLKDKKYYTFDKFKDVDFLSNRNMQKRPDYTKGLLKDLENYLNENSTMFSFIKQYEKVTKDEDFMMKGSDVSFFGSYYMDKQDDNVNMIFPYIYSTEGKYVVYRTKNESFKLLTSYEIMQMFQKKMF
jgi:hypothetical protein